MIMGKEIEANRKSVLKLLAYVIVLTAFYIYDSYQQDNRLNEHKRLLIAQQEQINQLILNARKNEQIKNR